MLQSSKMHHAWKLAQLDDRAGSWIEAAGRLFFVSVFEGGGQYHVWQAYEHIMKGW
jgi:hypothetical protein